MEIESLNNEGTVSPQWRIYTQALIQINTNSVFSWMNENGFQSCSGACVGTGRRLSPLANSVEMFITYDISIGLRSTHNFLNPDCWSPGERLWDYDIYCNSRNMNYDRGTYGNKS